LETEIQESEERLQLLINDYDSRKSEYSIRTNEAEQEREQALQSQQRAEKTLLDAQRKRAEEKERYRRQNASAIAVATQKLRTANNDLTLLREQQTASQQQIQQLENLLKASTD
jgi:hypothetical protein